MPLPDLIQEGNIALIEAVNSYEWEKGRLTTYASRNIEWKINRAIAEQSGIIRIPEYEQRELHKFERAKEKLSEGARDLSDLEIGNKIGIKQDKVEDLTALSKRTIISLTLSRREEDNNTVLQDTIPSKNPDVEEVVYSQEQNRLLMEGLHTLHTVDKRAEEIMIKRYGLDRQGDMSLSEVGEIFGVSRERVSGEI